MEIFVVDAFTDRPFAGNPAGVVLLTEQRDSGWMQAVAAEMKHAETAFCDLTSPGADPVPLRWFTPAAEVDLCGHATLATAHVLGGDRRFRTRSGVLTCEAGEDGVIRMDFPADPTSPAPPPPGLAEALQGVEIESVERGVSDFLVAVTSAADVRALRPDLARLAEIGARGVIVTAPGDRDGIDVVSRCFYPRVGVPEDPVTGSAHCTLATWWAPRLGRNELLAEQASPRGGLVRAVLRADRVQLAGSAVTVLRGQLTV
ncbi:PhzF family phenazine biosynthesis protein [Umezawaea beigongshangensis]|uniref:PhzF family phenazine biosynthesis protein n=1 Tax=Umezawaea beigongshangensis TaxID=2780383 RepID=UPI0018F2541D|nr:PhzF family phenazine biosynthesis protein [Umezawaea beigongshangensis]